MSECNNGFLVANGPGKFLCQALEVMTRPDGTDCTLVTWRAKTGEVVRVVCDWAVSPVLGRYYELEVTAMEVTT